MGPFCETTVYAFTRLFLFAEVVCFFLQKLSGLQDYASNMHLKVTGNAFTLLIGIFMSAY